MLPRVASDDAPVHVQEHHAVALGANLWCPGSGAYTSIGVVKGYQLGMASRRASKRCLSCSRRSAWVKGSESQGMPRKAAVNFSCVSAAVM